MQKQTSATLPEASLNELNSRLKQTRWPPVIGRDDWQYGVPQSWLREMVEYWVEEWDWNKQEVEMNRWKHYEASIDGIKLHYLHAPAKHLDAPPIILTHGWPWTFWDFKDVIGPLSDPESFGGKAEDAFNVYVPSLPGFGFSTPLTQSGVDVSRIASLWVKLMTEELGHTKFAAHGGDWGALVTAHLAHEYADKLLGAHMSLTLIPGVDRSTLGPEDYDAAEAW
ncbi:MAG: epoxide hydrolase, partial [Gammaproteobacteria bacterium]|nr:epoxide hydrolase [Gammaproteobacteria bacterium]